MLPTNTSSSSTEEILKKSPLSTVLWPLFGAIGVLVLVVGTVLILSFGRNENSMVRLLLGEGAALIYAVEGSVRMSMRQKAPVQLQRTLQELVNADVRFVSVLMPDGTVLAHNDVTRLGSVLRVDGEELNESLLRNISRPVEGSSLQWFIAHIDDKETFVIYREFMPTQPPVRLHPEQSRRRGNAPMRMPGDVILPPRAREPSTQKPSVQKIHPLIFLGLDIGPFEAGQKQDRVYVFFLASGVTLVGAALLLALYYAQRAQESRRRQWVAEGQVRELEEEIRRKEKMAAIGNLAAGVAHEIRNPLSSIKGYATYFGQRFAQGSADREAAQVMVREVERLNRVITDLIGLSRPTDIHTKAVDIVTVLDHCILLVRPDAAKHRVEFVLRRPKRPLPMVLLDVDRFGQALLNIYLNAMEAMPEGGKVTITVGVLKQKFLAIDIKDTGQGIAEEHMAHIFDPYFTTKGQGTGLGLATVHKIIEAHGGEIYMTSRRVKEEKKSLVARVTQENSGTTVHILLPLIAEKGIHHEG